MPRRSIGVWVEPGTDNAAAAIALGVPICGSDQTADALGRLRQLSVDRVELMLWPGNERTLAAIEPAFRRLDR